MNCYINIRRSFLRAMGAFALTLAAAGAAAQDTTTTHHRHGAWELQAIVRNAQIVYVEGGYTPSLVIQPLFDVLLFQPAPMPEPVNASVTAEHVDPPAEMATTLPETESSLPLLGALGLLSIASSIGLGLARKRATSKIKSLDRPVR